MSHKIIALGIDLGLANCGYAIVSRQNHKFKMVTSACLKTTKSENRGQRLLTLSESFVNLLTRYLPTIICIESVYFGKNVSSAMSTSAVIGVLELEATRYGIPILHVTPQQVKSVSGVGGRASKSQLRNTLNKLLRCELTNNHAADAAGCAMLGCLQSKGVFLGKKR